MQIKKAGKLSFPPTRAYSNFILLKATKVVQKHALLIKDIKYTYVSKTAKINKMTKKRMFADTTATRSMLP